MCVCLSSNKCSKSMDRMAQLYTIARKFLSAAPNIALNQSHERLQPRRWQVFAQHSASDAPKDVFFESMASQSLPNSASELIELQLPLGQLSGQKQTKPWNNNLGQASDPGTNQTWENQTTKKTGEKVGLLTRISFHTSQPGSKKRALVFCVY